jgi:hypothetical protein
MNNYFSSKLMGGLGNYLFQISAAYALSIKYNKDLFFDIVDIHTGHNSYKTYINNFFKKIKFKELENDYWVYNEPLFEYKEIPYQGGNLKLIGYFQSDKYFKDYRKEILDIFDLNDELKNKLKIKFKKELNGNTCSIHVRRGDYLSLQNYHTSLQLSYYENAVKYIGEDKNYLIFSDDINWCIENFNFIKNKTFISNNKDYEDMYLMSLCDDNIIANSSFSWWGAWLNKNKNKKVVYPKEWFGPSNKHLNTKDLFCELWIKI